MMKTSSKKRLAIAATLFTIFSILASPWTWKLDASSWEFYVNLLLLVILGLGWGWFMWWSLNKYGNNDSK